MDAEAWDERHRDAELVWSVGPNRCLVEETVGMPPGRELDVACGEGRNARWLAEQGWQVTATESPRSRSTRPAHSPIRRGLDLDLQVADATEPAPGGSYHLVIVCYLQVEPMVRRHHIATRPKRSPSGGMLIVGHDLHDLTCGVGGRPLAEVLLTVERVVDDLAGTGLEIERFAQVSCDVEQETAWSTARLTASYAPDDRQEPEHVPSRC